MPASAKKSSRKPRDASSEGARAAGCARAHRTDPPQVRLIIGARGARLTCATTGESITAVVGAGAATAAGEARARAGGGGRRRPPRGPGFSAPARRYTTGSRSARPALRTISMPAALPELAKLSRPRLFRVSARARLFGELDRLREHPVVWVAGAPGTGKSALVASWLEARKLASVWYHIDPGDADPGTFFHYLGRAAPARGRDVQPLPVYAEEYRRDLAGFARRWFRELFARMAPGSVLVFDDFHDARTGHAERAAFAAGLEEIPAGITVVAVSRGDPPPQFARLVARRAIGRLGAEALRFTLEEARELLGATGEADQRVIDRVWERVDGWAAGLILLHEHAAASGRPEDVGKTGPPRAVFDYFAGELLAELAPDLRRAVLASALPSLISPRVPGATPASRSTATTRSSASSCSSGCAPRCRWRSWRPCAAAPPVCSRPTARWTTRPTCISRPGTGRARRA